MSDLRDQFLFRRDVIYLNHGSFGACPRPVFEAYQAFQRELEAQPVAFLGRRFEQRMRRAREALAAYAGAAADDLVYVPNATTGLNIVARSLPLAPGDEVLATDHEYGALDRTWRFVCGRRGARYVRQPVPLPAVSREEMAEAVLSGITGRTRVLFVSHVTSPTAVVFPVAEIVRRAREAGLITVVDGAHAPGQLPLDLEALGADFYAANCHKWMMAPKGAGFLHARPDVQRLLKPLVVSWGWESEKPGPSQFVDEHEWQGTRDPAAYLAVPEAISFMASHDWPAVRSACREVLRLARREITALTGLEPLTPDAPGWFEQMAAFPLPDVDGEALQRQLHDRYAVEVPVIRWNGRHLLRISIQGYNSEDDVRALVRALDTLLAGMRCGDEK